MQLNNPFPHNVRLLYLYNNYECWECGSNGSKSGGLELHHNWGRISASALNSVPLCRDCHIKVLQTKSVRVHYLKKTIDFLVSEGYKLKDIDHEFLEMIKDDLSDFSF